MEISFCHDTTVFSLMTKTRLAKFEEGVRQTIANSKIPKIRLNPLVADS